MNIIDHRVTMQMFFHVDATLEHTAHLNTAADQVHPHGREGSELPSWPTGTYKILGRRFNFVADQCIITILKYLLNVTTKLQGKQSLSKWK